MRKLTVEEFIERANKIHNNKYNYSKSEYKGGKEKICIICPKHGEFWQTAGHHLQGHGCPKCKGEECHRRKLKDFNDFLKKTKEVHGDKYDYSKADYKDRLTKILIKCNKCGNEFWQTPSNHINSKQGCPLCKHRSYVYTQNEFLKIVKNKFGDKYDYSKINYKDIKTKITIKCNKHDIWFKITPHHFMDGVCGCPKCNSENKSKRQSMKIEDFIKKSQKVHGYKYDYSKVNYINNKTKVCIICPKHGEFWVDPFSHIYRHSGCIKCAESALESSFEKFLIDNKIKYIYNYRANWLGLQHLDFYLPDYKIAIECQGRQHFKSIIFFGGDEGLKKTKERDDLKHKKCQKNNIILLYYFEGKNKIEENNRTLNKILKIKNEFNTHKIN